MQVLRWVVGCAIFLALLFLSLFATDRETATLFVSMVESGPGVLAQLDAARRSVVELEIAHAFRAAFLTVALFMAGGMVLCWLNPVRRV